MAWHLDETTVPRGLADRPQLARPAPPPGLGLGHGRWGACCDKLMSAQLMAERAGVRCQSAP